MTAKGHLINVAREMFSQSSPLPVLRAYGALINSRTIAKAQSRRQGPPSVLVNGKVGSNAGTFIAWLEKTIEEDPRNHANHEPLQ